MLEKNHTWNSKEVYKKNIYIYITSTCHSGIKSADCLTLSNAFCNWGLMILLSWMLKICPIFNAAPKITKIIM